MKNIFIPLLLILCLISSCKKYGEGYIEGTVYEVGTNIPLAGIPIILDDSAPGGSSFMVTHTDKNGHYLIYYNKQRSPTYYISCGTDSFHIGTGRVQLDNKKQIVNFPLQPCSYVKLHIIKTTNYQRKGQYINITYSTNEYPGEYGDTTPGADEGGFIINNSNSFDTIIPRVFKIVGNSNKNYIEWDLVSPSNIDSNLYAPIIVPKGDTLLFTIQYK